MKKRTANDTGARPSRSTAGRRIRAVDPRDCARVVGGIVTDGEPTCPDGSCGGG